MLLSVNAAVAVQDVPSTTAAAGADSSSIVTTAHVSEKTICINR